MKQTVQHVFRSMKLKPKLMTAFTLTVLLPVTIASVFALTYFFNLSLENEKANLHDKCHTAELLYALKNRDVENIAVTTASDNLVILNLELLLDHPIQENLRDQLRSGHFSFISILDTAGNLRISGNAKTFQKPKAPLFDERLLKSVADGGAQTLNVRLTSEEFLAIEQVTMRPAVAIVSLAPIVSYSKQLLGFVMVGYVLGETRHQENATSLVQEIHENIGGPVLILREASPLVYSESPLDATIFSFPQKLELSQHGSENAMLPIAVNQQSYLYAFFPVLDTSNELLASIGIGVLEDSYLKPRNKAALLLSLISFSGFAVAALIAYTFSKRISQPVVTLMAQMKRVEDGDWNVRVSVDTEDEIGKLAETFNTMTLQLKESFQKIKSQSEQLRQRNSELKRLDKLKDEFLSNTSHELRTPLNGITGLAEAMLSGVDGPLNDEGRRHIRMIRQSSQRLTNLVNAILDLSKLRSSKMALNLNLFALKEVVEVVLEFAKELANNRSVSLTAELPDDLPDILGDIDRVEQILMNLVGNAVKFTREGTVTVMARAEEHGVKISVRDTGIGIPQEALAHIFQPFEQVDGSSTREFSGTGLGLSITKSLVEQHGGTIWCESEPGRGSVFHFTLPCQDGMAPPQKIRENTQEMPTEMGVSVTLPKEHGKTESWPPDGEDAVQFPVATEGGTILVVDDDPANIEVLRANLLHAGFKVISAGDANVANKLLRTEAVDLILCDVMMPGIDGYTFAVTLQERIAPHQSVPPLIFVTAKDRRENRLKGYHVGALDYITKPIDAEELRWKINALLRLKRCYTIVSQEEIIYTQDTVYEIKPDNDAPERSINVGHGEKILVVDDTPVNLEVLRTMLVQYHYDVDTASDGIEALEKIERERPDLLLLDLMMPKMSGYNVCKSLRRQKRFQDLPIIMLTAKSGLDDKIYGLNIGADDYLSKPFNKEELLTKVSVFLRILALQKEVISRNSALEQLNQELEQRVKIRTEELARTNDALQESLQTLQIAQDQLVQAEKMAALGTLVAGIAHEVNTPVGVAVMAASFLQDQTTSLKDLYVQREMTRSGLESYLKTADDLASSILRNLERAAQQIKNFKQVAVDQTSEEERQFRLKSYIEDLLSSLQPKLRPGRHVVHLHCPDMLEIFSFPGAFSQILTNFIMNSLKHAFSETTQGKIDIDVTASEETLRLRYHDNGRGLTEEERAHIFDPFYTTKRGHGGSGLGLYIVYNLVSQQLRGSIQYESEAGRGTTFLITIPLPQNAQE